MIGGVDVVWGISALTAGLPSGWSGGGHLRPHCDEGRGSGRLLVRIENSPPCVLLHRFGLRVCIYALKPTCAGMPYVRSAPLHVSLRSTHTQSTYCVLRSIHVHKVLRKSFYCVS
ncbi:unnamed protein product [Discosporangium mesarthrocarpum]